MILSLRDSELADIDCNRLIKRGVDAFACPVHEAKHKEFDNNALDKADGFILTSQQAAYALPDERKDRPVWCVGRASASSAKARGYHNVHIGTSDGRALADLIIQDLKTEGHHLCWLRATKISFDIKTALEAEAMPISQQIVYEMVAQDTLPETAIKLISDGQVKAVMALSKAQLGQAQKLFQQHDLWQDIKLCDLFVVSQAVADMATDAGWQSVIVARRKRAISVQAAVICHRKT